MATNELLCTKMRGHGSQCNGFILKKIEFKLKEEREKNPGLGFACKIPQPIQA